MGRAFVNSQYFVEPPLAVMTDGAGVSLYQFNAPRELDVFCWGFLQG